VFLESAEFNGMEIFSWGPLYLRKKVDVMRPRHAKILERICGLLVIAGLLAPVALADAQGWDGPGWYVSGAAPVNTPPATPAYILFNGPHSSQSECAVIYDRLYSPIGVCRFLEVKPGAKIVG
jgi:hypothetical protein